MKPIRVLVIEDNEDDLFILKERLSEANLSVSLEWADRVEKGIAVLSAKKIDVVLLDLDLPDSRGFETFTRVSRKAPLQAIIVLTGHTDEELGIQAISSGAQDYLVKGQIESRQLIRSIQYSLERKRSEEALRISESQVRRMIEKNGDALLVVDRNGIVRFTNPAAESLLCKKQAEILGDEFGYPVVARDKTEINITRPGKENATAEMRVVDFQWEDEPVYLVTLHDITGRKKLELERKRVNRELRQTIAELKGVNRQILEHQKSVIEEERLKVLLQISGATAQELQQPLTSLLANIESMKLRINDPGKMAQHLEMIDSCGKMIADIARRMSVLPLDEEKSHFDDSLTAKLQRKINLLVLEDSDHDFELLRRLITDSTMISISRALSIKEAIAVLEQETFDLVVSDYLLNDGNGLDFLNIIKKRGIELPVVVITGQGDEVIASRFIKAGAYDYIAKKDIDVASFYRSIARALEKFRLKKEIKLAWEKMIRMATRDDLTGLYNRRYFMEIFSREVDRAKRYQSGLVFCMIDLDRFKKINDTYGHLAGDLVLSEIGTILMQGTRLSDLVCRYGGEEFALILPGTDIQKAESVCERLRKSVSQHRFKYKSSQFKITISAGIAIYTRDRQQTAADLLEKADLALYQAKNSGRDRVVVYKNG